MKFIALVDTMKVAYGALYWEWLYAHLRALKKVTMRTTRVLTFRTYCKCICTNCTRTFYQFRCGICHMYSCSFMSCVTRDKVWVKGVNIFEKSSVTPETSVYRPSTKRDVTPICCMFSVNYVVCILKTIYTDFAMKTPSIDFYLMRRTCCEAPWMNEC